MATRQATLGDATIIALQSALAMLKLATDKVWPIYAEAGRQPDQIIEFLYSKVDENGFLPVEKFREVHVASVGGEENWKKVADVSGSYGRELDIIPADGIVDGKVDMRKMMTAWLMIAPLSAERKMEWAFTLADANKDGKLDQG